MMLDRPTPRRALDRYGGINRRANHRHARINPARAQSGNADRGRITTIADDAC